MLGSLVSKIFKVMIVWIVTVVSSNFCYAEIVVTKIPVDLGCSEHFYTASWTIYDGEPDVQYMLTTNGIRVAGSDEIEKVERSLDRDLTQSGVAVQIEARCAPRGMSARISRTGDFLSCRPGEGLRVYVKAQWAFSSAIPQWRDSNEN